MASDIYQTTSLPDTPSFLTSIIRQLATIQATSAETSNNNTLSSLSPENLRKAKPLLLSLHCLYPAELLLALDLLDRRLVRRYKVDYYYRGDTPSSLDLEPEEGEGQLPCYFVLSSSSSSLSSARLSAREGRGEAAGASTEAGAGELPSHSSSSAHLEKSYEVHLDSWSCSCPAFTLAAYRDFEEEEVSSRLSEDRSREEDATMLSHGDDNYGSGGWQFGGSLTRRLEYCAVPVCKHLLACVLGAECAGLFGGGIEEVAVSESEMAARYAV